MTKQVDNAEESNTDDVIAENEMEDLYAQHDKWKAALRFNKEMQANYAQEITKWRTQRDQLKEEIQAIREAALNEKAKRDEINAEVAILKEDRAAANVQIAFLKQKRNDAWDKVKLIRGQLRGIISQQKEAKQQLKPLYPMMKRLEEIEWNIITQSLPFKREEVLMDEFENIVNEISQRRKEVNFDITMINFEEAKQQIDEFRAAAQQYHELMVHTVEGGEKLHERIIDLGKKSEPHHQKMLEMFASIDAIKDQEEQAHQKMMDQVKEMEMLRTGYDEIIKELRAIEKKIGFVKAKEAMAKTRIQEAKEKQILDKKTEAALTKYKAGKKLDIHEFTLLMKQGLLKSD